MTVLCFANCAFLSETSRMIAIYQELKREGVPVRMASHGGLYESLPNDEGVPNDIIEPICTPEQHDRIMNAIINLYPPLYLREELLRSVQREIDYFRQHEIRVVISGFTISATLSARAVEIPLVVTHLGSFVPPILEKGLFTAAEHFDTLLTGWIPTNWLNRALAWLLPRAPVHLPLFNSVADELGIIRIRSFWDILMGDHTLVTDVPEILGITREEMLAWRPTDLKRHRPTARLAYAGPIFARLFGDVPGEVSAFLETDQPKVYVALASGERKTLQRVYDTLAGMPVKAVVCAMNHDPDLGVAENILVTDFLPAPKVMPLCDLAIIHGGQGSTQTAIASGTPVIGFPLQPEQNFNLHQLRRHGAGLCLSLRSLRRGRLRAAIEQVLEDGRFKQSMQRLQAWQNAVDGPTEVARYVSEML